MPVQFNDGSPVPEEMIGEACDELGEQFTGMSLEKGGIQGRWHYQGAVYRDNLVRLVVDFPELAKNRRWMKAFKARWKERLEQLELWMVSYRIEVE